MLARRRPPLHPPIRKTDTCQRPSLPALPDGQPGALWVLGRYGDSHLKQAQVHADGQAGDHHSHHASGTCHARRRGCRLARHDKVGLPPPGSRSARRARRRARGAALVWSLITRGIRALGPVLPTAERRVGAPDAGSPETNRAGTTGRLGPSARHPLGTYRADSSRQMRALLGCYVTGRFRPANAAAHTKAAAGRNASAPTTVLPARHCSA